MMRFEGKVALVTGAAGDIGQATAVQLASQGARVAVFDRREDLLAETVELCAKATGDAAAVLALGVDQTNADAVENGIARVADELGSIGVLFANAGYGRFARFLDQPAAEWDRHVAVNLTGTFRICQSVARRMVEQAQGGSIVVNASSGAEQHTDLLTAYCSTKAAIRMLAIGMASELGSHRIRVNCVMPGVVETGMTAPMLQSPDGAAQAELLLANTPVGRLGVPQDVANLVTFLLSDDAGFITGEAVMIDGGQRIHGHPQWYATDYRNEHEDIWSVGL
ncbi:MAG: SDR family oxidoreductase [Nocardioidaceae bacterium]|nr:MAG: SDR family oxidoreductase [Nocardioidaceae bacterium]